MTSIIKTFFNRFFGGFQARYIPLLMVYFAYGASGFTSIAETFLIKERLSLSAEALIVIYFWVSLPWTVKMVFGQFADSIRIFGSGRKIYIFIGGGLAAFGSLIMVGLAAQLPWLLQLARPEKLFFLSSIISMAGFVLQDVIADAMSTEVVDRKLPNGNSRPETEVDGELTQIQWLGKISLMSAGVVVAGLGGWLADMYSYETMFKLGLLIPLISVTGAIFVRLNPVPKTPINWWILGGGIAFGIFAGMFAFFEIPHNQEIVFMVSLSTLIFMISRVGIIKSVLFTSIVLFIFRAIPGAGPGIEWWQIDVLGFDKAFQGTLKQIGSMLALAGLFFFRKYITEKPIGFTLAWLTIAGAILVLPTIGLFYEVHNILGISARTIALVDTTISAPIGALSMIPLLALIAKTCPEGFAATWFALMASLMNLALSAGNLGTKYLNQLFVVTREVRDTSGAIATAANYDNIGILLIITWVMGLVIPLIAIWFFLRKHKTNP